MKTKPPYGPPVLVVGPPLCEGNPFWVPVSDIYPCWNAAVSGTNGTVVRYLTVAIVGKMDRTKQWSMRQELAGCLVTWRGVFPMERG